MGGLLSSSKVEDGYVLRTTGGITGKGKTEIDSLSGSLKKTKPGTTSEKESDALMTKQSSKAQLSKAPSQAEMRKQGSKVQLSHAPSHSDLKRQGSKAMERQGSAMDMRGGGPNRRHSSGAITSSSAAAAVKGIQNSRKTTTNIGGGQIASVSLPWLLKDANFGTGTSMSDFEFGKVIGRGLMGTVRLAKTGKGKYCVFKGVQKSYVRKHKDERHIASEKSILQTLNSPFCIKLFGTFQDKENLYFALEFAPGGELFHRLGKKKSFPAPVAKFYMSEVFVALEHVHSYGFVYRDLKPENIMLDEEGHCKLIDFGFSTSVADLPDGKLHTLCGTPAYLSPEQLDGKFTNGYTKIIDWWAFGVLLYELLTGSTPFCSNPRDSHYEIFLRILKNKISYPRSMDNPSRELISQLCLPQVEKRLTDVEDIKKREYFEMPWAEVEKRNLVPPFVPRLTPEQEGDLHYFDAYPPQLEGAKYKPGNEVRFSADFPDF